MVGRQHPDLVYIRGIFVFVSGDVLITGAPRHKCYFPSNPLLFSVLCFEFSVSSAASPCRVAFAFLSSLVAKVIFFSLG